MRHLLLASVFLGLVSLAACATTPTSLTSTPVDSASEEAQVRALVQGFGKRLGQVSLLAPDAAQELQTQYSEFVSPALLQSWMKDPSNAPGRRVSSPWPDRIEITTLAKVAPDRYVITGNVIEITSVELVSGGAAATLPVRIVAQRSQGRWLIAEYTEEQ